MDVGYQGLQENILAIGGELDNSNLGRKRITIQMNIDLDNYELSHRRQSWQTLDVSSGQLWILASREVLVNS